ncbi:sodium/potassium-transporting ATPase subunit beta-2-like [Athalia rosae]|uniref:sodium/potassium-transporting ATPase subunit beta-2-like n=1 Tax=Athalia rosae TaxID=37344 RepID=UPI002033A01E|nr:sodium/potassium-transporting ATPase subunit beta-2-like [Athalia rosae]
MACTVRGKPVVIHPAFYAAGIILVAVIGFLIFYHVDPRVHYAIFGASDDTNIVNGIPGLIVRPRITEAGKSESLIMYNSSDRNSYMRWVDALDDFLKVYRKPGLTPGRGSNIYNCDYIQPPAPGRVCDVDIKNWMPCIKENYFNYHKSAPCVFLKLSQISGWRPSFYNDTNSLPEAMPRELKQYIMELKSEDAKQLNTIWVSCEGENPADMENIGPVNILPRRGFPGYFYPYENSEGYLSPLVAIHFERPRTGILINVECKAWARNIKHDSASSMGAVHFELMID